MAENELNRMQNAGRLSLLKFYNGDDLFFDAMEVWSVYNTSRSIELETDLVFSKWYVENESLSLELYLGMCLRYVTETADPVFTYASIGNNTKPGIVYSMTALLDKNVVIYFRKQKYVMPNSSHIVLMIMSKYFHPDAFKIILFNFLNRIMSGQGNYDEILMRDIEEFNRSEVTVSSDSSRILETLSIDISPYKEISNLIKLAFTLFNPSDILRILDSLLIGCNIVVISKENEKIGPGCFMLLALFAPIDIPYSFISWVPSSEVITGCPAQSILGLNRNMWSRSAEDESTVIDLDRGKVIKKDTPRKCPKLYSLEKYTLKHLQNFCTTWRRTRNFNTKKLLWILRTYILGSIAISLDMNYELISYPISMTILDQFLNNKMNKMKMDTNNGHSFEERMCQNQSIVEFCEMTSTGNRKKIQSLQTFFSGHVADVILYLT